jgi:hypothetical protein
MFDVAPPRGPAGAKRLESAGLPALLDGLGPCESGSKLPHSKGFTLRAAWHEAWAVKL